MIGIHSEIGKLKEVIVHRPGVELDRITPDNAKELLFDDVLWSNQARREHDFFVNALKEHDITVYYFYDLLIETLEIKAGRKFILDRICAEETHGVTVAKEMRYILDNTDSKQVANYLIGGILKSDLSPFSKSSLRWQSLSIDDFILPPIPNTLFQRDSSSWIGEGVNINPLAKIARKRESINIRAIYQYNPLFSNKKFPIYYGNEDIDYQFATIEGGDIHVIADGILFIGIGERTTPQGVEAVAKGLFDSNIAKKILVVELPKIRALMHLDTFITMIDKNTFVMYPHVDYQDIRSWIIRPGNLYNQANNNQANNNNLFWVEERKNLTNALAEVLDVDSINMLKIEESTQIMEREQWNDANNYLTLEPGIVIGYDRNIATNTMLRRNGIEVITVPSNELSRGRGGTRCMSCPISRDAI